MIGIIDVGGGTRGVYGAGVFDYCMDNGIGFDYVIGVSAGSANGAAFLAGQRARNLRYYDRYAFRREYMSWHNMLHKGEYLDLDYIYSTLSNSDGEDPLDYAALMQNPVNLEIVATNALDGMPTYFSKSDMRQDCYDCIKASCAVPIACKPYMVGGKLYFDGGLSDPIPYRRAFEQGCDRLVIVLTKPKTMFRTPGKDVVFARRLRKNYPRAAELLESRSGVYNDSLRAILSLEEQGIVKIIAPDDIGKMKTLTQDHEAIRILYAKGYADAEGISGFLSNRKVRT